MDAKAKRKAYQRAYYLKTKEARKQQDAEYREKNREKLRAYAREYRAKNLLKVSAQLRAYNLKKKFGITDAEYDRKLESQDGLCAICRQPEKLGRRLAVDHCHHSGKVRGLLCYVCNTKLGTVESMLDDALSLTYMKSYGII